MNQFDKSNIREPGRLATVHEKLMSPSRKKNSEVRPENVRAQIEMKQKEAAQRREDIQVRPGFIKRVEIKSSRK